MTNPNNSLGALPLKAREVTDLKTGRLKELSKVAAQIAMLLDDNMVTPDELRWVWMVVDVYVGMPDKGRSHSNQPQKSEA